MNILKELEKFNLTENEAKVYVACLKLGPASIQQIGEEAKLNRVTVYGLVETLIEKGFLRHELVKNKRKIAAYPPMKLYDIVSQRGEQLKRQEKLLETLVPDLKRIQGSQSAEKSTSVIYYEGAEGLKNWATDVLSHEGEVLEWTRIEDFTERFEEYLRAYYFPRKFREQICTRFIFMDTPQARKYAENLYLNNKNASPMKARFIPLKEFPAHEFMVIYGDRFSVALPAENRAIVVIDKDVADFQRKIFEFGWQHATGEIQNKPYPSASSATLSPRERDRG